MSRLAGAVLSSAVLLAACGSHALAASPATVTVSIEVKVSTPRPRVRRFSLGCHPTAGTLPSATRVCALIDAHPAVMLRPTSTRTLCYDPKRGPVVSVRVVRRGRVTRFSGEPGCGWHGLSALTVYYNASIGRARLVD